jgi:hypothetical protein
MTPAEVRNASMCQGKRALTYCEAVAIPKRSTPYGKNRAKYRCPVCRAWHLGQHPKKIKRA